MNLARRGFLAGGCALCAAKLMACTPTNPDGRPVTGIDGNADLAPRVAPGSRTGASASLDDAIRAQTDRLERNVRGSRFLIRDAKANAYVRRIVADLAGDYAKDIRTYVMRVPEFNASQYPNGMMQVWTGLMVRCTNESQLAAVLGHEIAHYTRAHGLVGMTRQVQAVDISQFLAFIFAGAGMGQLNDISNFIMSASIMSYGRDQEREADEIGIRLLAEHGLAPIEAARNWEFVTEEMKARNIPRHFSLLESSHPGDTERAASLRHRAAELPKGESRSVEYREGLAALREMLFEDQIRTGAHVATIMIADRWLEGDPKDGLPLYAKGEALRLRSRDTDDKDAVAALAAAIEDPRAPAVAWRSLGLLRRKFGQESEARELFNDYLRRAPDAPDREIVRRSLAS
jgi:beta-barrel assembly-enhancing protease